MPKRQHYLPYSKSSLVSTFNLRSLTPDIDSKLCICRPIGRFDGVKAIDALPLRVQFLLRLRRTGRVHTHVCTCT